MVYASAMRKFVPLLIIFMALPAFARDVYKWTNEEGVVIYSDTYQEGAQRVRVSDERVPASRVDEEANAYSRFEIVQPANDATIRSDGSVAISLSLSPALAEGHEVKIVVDGSELEGGMKGTQFTLKGLARGSHSLQTRVVDAEGNVLITSNSINFTLRQEAINEP